MNHLSELQLSMLIDGALTDADTDVVNRHIEDCEQCRAQLAIYDDDKRMIRSALCLDQPEIVPVFKMPAFKTPLGFREFALANLATGLLFWLVQFSWKTVFGEVAMSGFSWLTSMVVPDVYDLGVSITLFLTLEGTAMFDTYSGFIVAGIVACTAVWAALYFRKSRLISFSVLLTVIVVGMPQEANAVERQSGDFVLGSEETIKDTLVFIGETLSVDGNIEGDLIALGSRIVINGDVKGNLVVMGESVTVSGEITGTTINVGQSIELAGAIIQGDFWGAGRSVRLNKEARVSGNAIMAGETTSVAGHIGRDFVTAAETADFSGQVGEDVMAFGPKLLLLGDAVIRGDLTVHSHGEDSLQQSSGATIGGDVIFNTREYDGKSRNRYATAGFYGGQFLRLVAAFIVGYILFVLFPRMREVSLSSGIDGLTTAGVGLLALVSAPVILLLLALTVVGLPLTMLGMFIWLAVLYLAKILVAWLIGVMLIADKDDERSVAATVLAGIAIVIVMINLPFVGGFFNLVLTVIGFGMMTQWVMANRRVPA